MLLLVVSGEGEGRHSGGVTQLAGDDRGRTGCLLSSLLSLYLSLSAGIYIYYFLYFYHGLAWEQKQLSQTRL